MTKKHDENFDFNKYYLYIKGLYEPHYYYKPHHYSQTELINYFDANKIEFTIDRDEVITANNVIYEPIPFVRYAYFWLENKLKDPNIIDKLEFLEYVRNIIQTHVAGHEFHFYSMFGTIPNNEEITAYKYMINHINAKIEALKTAPKGGFFIEGIKSGVYFLDAKIEGNLVAFVICYELAGGKNSKKGITNAIKSNSKQIIKELEKRLKSNYFEWESVWTYIRKEEFGKYDLTNPLKNKPIYYSDLVAFLKTLLPTT